MKDVRRKIALSCVCGQGRWGYGGNGRFDYWHCCNPWVDEATGEIVGYGDDKRPTLEFAPAILRKKAVKPNGLSGIAALIEIDPGPPGMTTALYERYDADGVFLYVGISDAPRIRASIHLRRSTWFQFAVSGSVRWYPSRAMAEADERIAIETRIPIFNRQHARPEAHEALIRYLVDKGRFDLLETTAKWG